MKRNPTRRSASARSRIGGGHPVVVQSMCATKTQDVDATVAQVEAIRRGRGRPRPDRRRQPEGRRGAGRDPPPDDGQPRRSTSRRTTAWRREVAPHVDKIRYNPGHLYHHEKDEARREKVALPRRGRPRARLRPPHRRQLRLRRPRGEGALPGRRRRGHGRVAPSSTAASSTSSASTATCVTLKDSDPRKVIEANRRFAEARPDVPLHLGVTEAGIPPEGIIKTRVAFEQLLSRGIGDTLRVSLTLPNPRKHEEIDGRARRSSPTSPPGASARCPSSTTTSSTSSPARPARGSRTRRFVELAEKVKEMTAYAESHALTIAVMGCRVNGPGETDDADLGLWCGPTHVNLKRRDRDPRRLHLRRDPRPAAARSCDALIAARGGVARDLARVGRGACRPTRGRPRPSAAPAP